MTFWTKERRERGNRVLVFALMLGFLAQLLHVHEHHTPTDGLAGTEQACSHHGHHHPGHPDLPSDPAPHDHGDCQVCIQLSSQTLVETEAAVVLRPVLATRLGAPQEAQHHSEAHLGLARARAPPVLTF